MRAQACEEALSPVLYVHPVLAVDHPDELAPSPGDGTPSHECEGRAS